MCNVFNCGRESDRKREKKRVNERVYARVENTGWGKGRFCFLKLAGLSWQIRTFICIQNWSIYGNVMLMIELNFNSRSSACY